MKFYRKPISLLFAALLLNACGSDDKNNEKSNEELFSNPPPETVTASVKSLDLSRVPTTEELIAAGQLGGNLTPTSSIDKEDPEVARQMLKDFGEAIEKWNQHDYRTAYFEFKEYEKKYPSSPWTGEAKLHMGCESRFNGRYNEAAEHFESIITDFENSEDNSAQWLVGKAKMRLAVTRALENNFPEALRLFSELTKDGYDWRIRTYASNWVKRLSTMKANKQAMLNCGSLALASILERQGRVEAAEKVRELLPQSEKGFSIDELRNMANEYGVDVSPVALNTNDLKTIPLPAILQIDRKNSASGHYWILEKAASDHVILHDTQIGRRYKQTYQELSKEWQGVAVVFADSSQLPGRPLSDSEATDLFGGCCGIPRPEDGPGNPNNNGDPNSPPPGDSPDPNDDSGCDSQGAPIWMVNPVSMNLYVKDTPLWYAPAYGPNVHLALSYNSQSSIQNYEPFGNKWTVNYGSYLVVDPGERATIFMPDGQRLTIQQERLPDIALPAGGGSSRRKRSTTNFQGPNYIKPKGTAYELKQVDYYRYELRFGDGTVFTYARPEGTDSIQTFLTTITDKYGHSLKVHYNADVKISSVEDAQGRHTRFSYNSQGLVSTVEDPFGRIASFGYDTNKNLTSLTDMGGFNTTIAYDDDVYVTEIRNPKGAYKFKVEPAEGDRRGGTIHYNEPDAEFMWENYRITITDPNGGKEEYYYDGYSALSWYVSPNNYVEYESQSHNNYTHAKKTIFNYEKSGEKAGLINKITYPDGSFTTQDFSEIGLGKGFKTSQGESVQYERNGSGYISKVTRTDGQVMSYEFAGNNRNIKALHTPNGTIHYEYNDKWDITKVTDSSGRVTTFEYNNVHDLKQVTHPNGSVKTYSYQPDRHLKSISLDGKVVQSFTYDEIGRISQHTDSLGETYRYEYNGIDSIKKLTYPDGQTSEWQYGQCPRLIEKVIGRGGRFSKFTTDSNKWVTEVLSQDGSRVQFEYDKNGNLQTLIDELGRQTKWEYDEAGKATKKTYTNGDTITFNYDDKQRLKSVTDPRGVAATKHFGQFGRLDKVTYSDGTPEVGYKYNEKSQITEITDAIGTHKYTYDNFGRLVSHDGPWDNDTKTYHYDALGRIQKVELQGSDPVEYSYDQYDRLVTIKSGTNTYTYDYDGIETRYKTLTYPNGVVEKQTFGVMSRLNSVVYEKDGKPLSGNAFTYNNRDLIVREELKDAAPLTRIQAEKQVGEFSNNVNQLTTSVTKTLAGETLSTQVYQYDKAGNQTQGFTEKGISFTAEYNALSQLKRIQWTEDGKQHEKTYRYFFTRFLAEIIYQVDGKDHKTTRFVRSGLLPLQERNSQNEITRNLIWGQNIGGGIGGLLNIHQNSQDYFYSYDGKGNVTSIFDKNAKIQAAYDYDAYGALIAKAGTFKQPYLYSTKRLDTETGFYYFGYRYYTPQNGRWLNRDPIEEQGGINLYGYVDGNPVGFVDPYGLESSPTNFLIGYGDETSCGITEAIRSNLGTNGTVDQNDIYYRLGTNANPKGLAKNIAKKIIKKVRPYLRKKTKTNAWDNAEDGTKKGTKKCPDCSKDVVGNPHKNELRNTPDGWDVEHVEKWEKIRRNLEKKGATKKEINDAYNDLNNTILRCRTCNRRDNKL